jgi:protein-S-isoprenylcysteine O-methyltransferase Ste14
VARIPNLGPRGEGWVLVQIVLLVAIGFAGLAISSGGGPDGPIRVAALVLGGLGTVVGGLIAVASILALGSNLSPFPRPTVANELVETGAYRYLRHPVYAGIVLAAIGWGLLTGSLLAIALSFILLLWFDLKARREEAWLAARHPAYEAYRARTRKFVPFIY